MLMTPEQFEESLKKLKPRIFMNGKRVDNVLENKNTRTVVEANKASYAWALDPRYKDIMTCYSPLVDGVANRYTCVSASVDDLVKKAEAGTFTAEMLGTCIYRCVGYDAFHSLAATTWEMDRDLDTKYHSRFLEYLKMVQNQDLSVAGALTEPRGSRSKKTLEWSDPNLSLRVVDKNEDGIVVRGAKINISGAYASHELVVLPQAAPPSTWMIATSCFPAILWSLVRIQYYLRWPTQRLGWGHLGYFGGRGLQRLSSSLAAGLLPIRKLHGP